MRNKKVYICIVLLLSLAFAAVIYHRNAIEEAYKDGERVGYSDGKSVGYDKGYNTGYSYYKKIKDEYQFFHDYAVITTSTGKRYHRYNCYHISNRRFCIYNISTAESKGYTPCLDCYPTADDIIKKFDEKYGIQR